MSTQPAHAKKCDNCHEQLPAKSRARTCSRACARRVRTLLQNLAEVNFRAKMWSELELVVWDRESETGDELEAQLCAVRTPGPLPMPLFVPQPGRRGITPKRKGDKEEALALPAPPAPAKRACQVDSDDDDFVTTEEEEGEASPNLWPRSPAAAHQPQPADTTAPPLPLPPQPQPQPQLPPPPQPQPPPPAAAAAAAPMPQRAAPPLQPAAAAAAPPQGGSYYQDMLVLKVPRGPSGPREEAMARRGAQPLLGVYWPVSGGGSEGPAYEPEGPFTLVPALEVNWGYAKAKAEVAAFLRRSALVYELPFAESAAQQSAQLDREKDLLLGALDGKVGDENDESRVFEC
jgi:hypothetical protein